MVNYHVFFMVNQHHHGSLAMELLHLLSARSPDEVRLNLAAALLRLDDSMEDAGSLSDTTRMQSQQF